MADEPLQKSVPRSTSGWGQNWIAMPNDAGHQNLRAGIPMQPVTGPVTGIDVQPHPSMGFTSRPSDHIGSVGGINSEPTTGKTFGAPLDARLYPAVGFQKPMGGPGTSPSEKAPFTPAKMGQSTTIVAGFGNQTPSGRGLVDQPGPRLGSQGSGSNLLPQEYHPQITTANISGRRRYFR